MYVLILTIIMNSGSSVAMQTTEEKKFCEYVGQQWMEQVSDDVRRAGGRASWQCVMSKANY